MTVMMTSVQVVEGVNNVTMDCSLRSLTVFKQVERARKAGHAILAASPLVSTKLRDRTAKLRRLPRLYFSRGPPRTITLHLFLKITSMKQRIKTREEILVLMVKHSYN